MIDFWPKGWNFTVILHFSVTACRSYTSSEIYSILLSGVRITSWLFQESSAQQLKVAHAIEAAVVWTTPSRILEVIGSMSESCRGICGPLATQRGSAQAEERNPDRALYNLVALSIYKMASGRHNAGFDTRQRKTKTSQGEKNEE